MRVVREMVEIKLHRRMVNHNGGLQLSSAWLPAIDMVELVQRNKAGLSTGGTQHTQCIQCTWLFLWCAPFLFSLPPSAHSFTPFFFFCCHCLILCLPWLARAWYGEGAHLRLAGPLLKGTTPSTILQCLQAITQVAPPKRQACAEGRKSVPGNCWMN